MTTLGEIKERDRITSLILQRNTNMTRLLFCLLILQISLSFQSSDEDWSFEEDSKGGWSSEVSNEAEMPFNGRIYGGKEADPSIFFSSKLFRCSKIILICRCLAIHCVLAN